MEIHLPNSHRKPFRPAPPTFDTACAITPAVRLLLTRFDISISLARTVAELAQLGMAHD